MKIAAITITYNDGFKFDNWYNYYSSYKKDLFLHIIVDNGSNDDYFKLVSEKFTDSIIIKRSNNGGCTGAYNDGITYALSNQNIDAILLIGNDVELEKNGLPKLYKFLFSNSALGMVAPVLLKAKSQIVEDFGCAIDSNLYMKPYYLNMDIDKLSIKNHEVQTVTGGMNLATRLFYEKVGLQDDKLFMYSDEVDMSLRGNKLGFKFAVTKEVYSWHNHINNGNATYRPQWTYFLISRNKVYLAIKHFGMIKGIKVYIFHTLKIIPRILLNINNLNFILNEFAVLKGATYGFFNIMDNTKLF